jgi:hypothetical protein
MELPPRVRLEHYLERARRLAEEGVAYPVEEVQRSVESDLDSGRPSDAIAALSSAEVALDRAIQEWAPVRDLLDRDDRLRAAALELGLDPPPSQLGRPSPRELLGEGPFSEEHLARARAAATASTRALTHQILQFGVSESRKLGTRIRAASQRGEDVSETTDAFRRLVRTIGARAALDVGDRLAELRHAAARIPSAPAFPVPMTDEEQEVLTEARQFARRIHRIKRTALDATSAARLVTHVRAALSEDRRSGTPQEEVEELWGEVARLRKEPALRPVVPPVPRPTRRLPPPDDAPSEDRSTGPDREPAPPGSESGGQST